MRRILLISASAVFASLSAAAVADDREDCSSEDSDRMIRGCSAVVDSRHELRQTLAIAYHRRGVAYARQKDYDRAIADYTRAIELEPRNPNAYNDRGIAYTSKGDYERAIADVTRAVELVAEPPSRPAATAAMPTTSSTAKNAPSASIQIPPSPKATAPEPEKTNGNKQPSWAKQMWQDQPN